MSYRLWTHGGSLRTDPSISISIGSPTQYNFEVDLPYCISARGYARITRSPGPHKPAEEKGNSDPGRTLRAVRAPPPRRPPSCLLLGDKFPQSSTLLLILASSHLPLLLTPTEKKRHPSACPTQTLPLSSAYEHLSSFPPCLISTGSRLIPYQHHSSSCGRCRRKGVFGSPHRKHLASLIVQANSGHPGAPMVCSLPPTVIRHLR